MVMIMAEVFKRDSLVIATSCSKVSKVKIGHIYLPAHLALHSLTTKEKWESGAPSQKLVHGSLRPVLDFCMSFVCPKKMFA